MTIEEAGEEIVTIQSVMGVNEDICVKNIVDSDIKGELLTILTSERTKIKGRIIKKIA